MTLTSIIKTIVQLYCSSIFLNPIVTESLSHRPIVDPTNHFPVLLAQETGVTPTTPPHDRGSGR